jgi:succinate-acetate transporter protein
MFPETVTLLGGMFGVILKLAEIYTGVSEMLSNEFELITLSQL